MRRTILVDMDMVLADFNASLTHRISQETDIEPIPLEAITTKDLQDSYPVEHRDRIRAIYHSPGFFLNLQPVKGAIEAMGYLRERSELFICTAPLKVYDNCVLEKYRWVEEKLGLDMVRRVVMTRDKTLVIGDVLIDDRIPAGSKQPTWEHVLYDQPSNKMYTDRRRLTWDNYREVLDL